MNHKYIRKSLLVLFSVVLCFATTSFAADTPQKPDATLTLSGGSAAIGVGFQWGKGTLNFKGKTYEVKYDGMSLGEVGGSGKNLTGEVYNLKSLDDFAGRYSAVKTGAALAAGGEVSTMSNDKGVKIDLHGVERGVKLTLGAEGLKFSFADDTGKNKG